MKKKLLCVALAATLICGCGTQSSTSNETSETIDTASVEEAVEENTEEVTDEASEDATDENTDGTVMVTDMNDREVAVATDYDSVVLTALPLPSIYAITGAPIEYLTGVHPGSTSATENSIMGAMYPELIGVKDDFIDGLEINVEELLTIDPDVVIYWGEYEDQYNTFKSVNIPAIGVQGVADGNVLETLRVWLDIMGKAFGTSGSVDEVFDYAKAAQDEVNAKLADLKDEEKPRVLYLYNHSKEQISVSGSNFYGGYWIDAAGGQNVAAEIEAFGDVNMEQIYAWDPEIIVITTFTETMPEDLYNNTIDGQDWSKVSAVKNGKVYKEPLGAYRWYVPTGDTPLMYKWMAQVVHPELFDYDMVKEIQDYYKSFYNYDVTDDQADGILKANPEAAKGTHDWNASKK